MYIHIYIHISLSLKGGNWGVKSGFIPCLSNPCVVCYNLFIFRRDSLNLIMATGVRKLMITEYCKTEINTFVSFPNGLLLDRYSWLYFSHSVNINKVAKTIYISKP